MSLAQEAQALFKAALDDPADEVPRLVFADWLEDTGTADNTAWAFFIRLGTVTHHGAMLPRERAMRRAAAAEGVVAKLTLPLPEFVARSVALLHLLPAPNVTVKLSDGVVPLAIVDQVWESLCREQLFLPIEWSGWHPNGSAKNWTERTLVVAASDPGRLQVALDRREPWLWDDRGLANGIVHWVRANADEILAGIDRNYTRLGEERAVRSLLLGFPVSGPATPLAPFGTLDIPPVVRLTQGILTDAIYRQANLVRMIPGAVGCTVTMRNWQGWRDWNHVPWWLQYDVISHLRQLADLPELRDGRPNFEAGVLRFEHRDQVYEFGIEITNTVAGPDVTIQLTM